jgi:hypothetical protein
MPLRKGRRQGNFLLAFWAGDNFKYSMEKKIDKARLLWILTLVVFFFLTRLGLHSSVEKSAAFSLVHWLCIFGQLALFLLAIFGWGGILRQKEQNSKAEIFLLGVLIFIGWIWASGAVGGLGESTTWIHLSFLLVGMCLAPIPTFMKAEARATRNSLTSIGVPAAREALAGGEAPNTADGLDAKFWVALVPVVLFFVMGILQAMQLQVLEDVLSYHLYAPQRWWSAGSIFFDRSYPHLYLASYWEMLYLWALAIFPAGHLQSFFVFAFAQLTHFSLGLMGSFWILLRIFRGFPIKKEWALIAALYGVSLFPLLWTSWHAKNDYGALFLVLGSILFLLEHKFFRAGLCLGIGVAAKMSAVFSLTAVPILLLLFLRQRVAFGNARNWLFLLLGLVLSLFPFLLRNFLATGNPFFPFLVEQLSPTIASATLKEVIYSVLGNQSGGEFLPVFVIQFVREPLLIVSLILVGLGFWQKLDLRLLSLATVVIVPLIAASAWLGKWLLDSIFVRYVALSLVFANSLPFVILEKVIVARKSNGLQWLGLVVVIALWFLSKPFLPWASFASWPGEGSFYRAYQENIPGLECREWLAKNTQATETIISLEDDYLFLMNGASIRVAAHDPEIDPLIRNSSGLSFLPDLQKFGSHYLFHVRRESGRAFYKNSSELHQALLSHPGKVLGTTDCVIVAL